MLYNEEIVESYKGALSYLVAMRHCEIDNQLHLGLFGRYWIYNGKCAAFGIIYREPKGNVKALYVRERNTPEACRQSNIIQASDRLLTNHNKLIRSNLF